MAEEGAAGGSGDGLLDLEKELTCSICTDILYQPLTLLDCLHTFCGGCVKEWFAWQAISASDSRKRLLVSPYTCPSCRETVRGTKADWRLTALLEGYLKANPGKGKTEEDKEELRKHYKPGNDVIPPIDMTEGQDDSEDERLVADVMEMSMANVDPAAARRRQERARERQRRRQQERDRGHRPEELRRQQQSSRWMAQQAERQRQEEDRQVEHQPSLRSLLSNSEISSEDVQQEILQSIYSEGLLDGIDIDNLTPAQEEELTERIAEAYRRRQRHRDRSRNRERRQVSTDTSGASSPRTHIAQAQQSQSRARPPISRPHLFEQQAPTDSERHHRRSASSNSQHTRRAERHLDAPRSVAPGARSATDLSVQPRGNDRPHVSRPRASSGNTRSFTDPARTRTSAEGQRPRATSNTLRPNTAEHSRPQVRNIPADPSPQDHPSSSITDAAATAPLAGQTAVSAHAAAQQEAHLNLSTTLQRPDSAAPEAVTVASPTSTSPDMLCSRCGTPDMRSTLHYNCAKCDAGNFNLCIQCYRDGKGCKHWFGFGLAAMYRWQKVAEAAEEPRNFEFPHILLPRKYINLEEPNGRSTIDAANLDVHEGAFCELCLSAANECYWYCNICLDGAWGYCNSCVLKGRHCTHPILAIAHLSTLRNTDPSRIPLCLPVPHLKQDSYVLLPVLTDCDVCRKPISLRETRFHCYRCSGGDYDICNECYHSLVATGKITTTNGPNGWRRCLQGHRMSVIGYQDTPTPAGPAKLRTTMREMVGGWRLKEENHTRTKDDMRATPADAGSDTRSLAIWSRWPKVADRDELSFPKNAEFREVEDLNADWSVAVYTGRVGLVPKNYTRRI